MYTYTYIIIIILLLLWPHIITVKVAYIYYVYVVKLGFLSSFMGISPERWQRLPHADPGQLIKSPEKK